MSDVPALSLIRRRLRLKAFENGEIVDFVHARYAVERLLFRLGNSQHADKFVLKGAMLFYLWNENLHRPTRDLDLLGFGPQDLETVAKTLSEIASLPCPEDGILFAAESITTEPIREDGHYGGVRAKLQAVLGESRIRLQIDIGYGDAVTPAVELQNFPVLVEGVPAPRIRAYPIYTVVAEKLEAIISLGERNSRMKDFFDLRFILLTERLNTSILETAIARTFERRDTPIPTTPPFCLTAEFAALKEGFWRAFLKKNGLESVPSDFPQVIQEIRTSLPFVWAKAH